MIDFSEIQRRITIDLSIEELEARLKPRERKLRDDIWSDHSSGGFLAPDEHLLEVIRADYEILNELGITYAEMAKLSNDILKQVIKDNPIKENTLTRLIRRFAPRYLNQIVDLDRERFEFMLIGSGGVQTCPWGCTKDQNGYTTSGSGQVYITSKEGDINLMKRYLEISREVSSKQFPNLEFNEAQKARREILRDLERGIGIEFGGTQRVFYLDSFTVITDLTPHLISSHYFFQGEASYRTDPRKLLEVVKPR